MVDRVYATDGHAATYTHKSGKTLLVVVLVERNLAQYGQVAAVMGKSAVVNVRLSDLLIAPRRGETFTLASGEVLTIDSLLTSDGTEHKAVAA